MGVSVGLLLIVLLTLFGSLRFVIWYCIVVLRFV